jgi:hypothetical protein
MKRSWHSRMVAGFDGPLSRRNQCTVTRDEDDCSIGGDPLGIANNNAPMQLAHITRREVPISAWGNVRIGYLKKRPIPRRSLITYVANQLEAFTMTAAGCRPI